MSVIATALKHLMAAGVSGDDLVRAVAEMEAATDTRSTGAKRQARYRESKRNKASQNVTCVTSDASDAPPPNDIYSNPPPEPKEAKASSPPLADLVVSVWNEGPAKRGATAARTLDASRRKLLAARQKDHGDHAVLEAIRNLATSPFHCGENDRGWKANIGWFLKAENFLKALEMVPPPTAPAKPAQEPETIDELERALAFASSYGYAEQPRYLGYREKLDRLRCGWATGPPGQSLGNVANRLMGGMQASG